MGTLNLKVFDVATQTYVDGGTFFLADTQLIPALGDLIPIQRVWYQVIQRQVSLTSYEPLVLVVKKL
jgi:hypothetical protein